ncbi:DUF1211 domain-containing membrane protein [Frondihabitans sucicola]|uniref:DUF1211 domain-containing membrane protein n=1 Tax=Frondihabitans sucicola TaxID=1268041 RepID=A0ABN6Y2H2_9MICO|nr:TMEM175 family protein [Frondihabitans sucicola]BDZ51261.1 DUF1211 domain-containing membrane protein [Frondihabitans sucicola]
MAAPRTSRGLDRLVNFTDASVAIAITLLILPLVDVATDIAHEPIGKLLHENLGLVLSFVITFLVISRFWVVHHRIFEYVESYSRPLIAVNFVWLLSIVFLPFAANVLSRESGPPGISALYIGTMLVATIAAGCIDWILLHDSELTREESRADLHLSPAVISAILMASALLVAVLIPRVNLYALLLLLLAGPIQSQWDSRH